MNANLIFWPVLAQITLTFVAFALLGVRKTRALKDDKVDLAKAALDNDAWPESVLKVSNNIRNQFQLPVIFYALCLVYFSLGVVNIVVLSLAWAFVICRVIHAWIHMGSNFVPARFRVFLIGFTVLVIMTIFAIKALLA